MYIIKNIVYIRLYTPSTYFKNHVKPPPAICNLISLGTLNDDSPGSRCIAAPRGPAIWSKQMDLPISPRWEDELTPRGPMLIINGESQGNWATDDEGGLY